MTIERFHSRGQHIRLFIGTKESFYIRKAGFYLGFIIWGRSPEWPKATSLLEGSAAPPPEIFWNEYALRCNMVHFETQFWEMLQCVQWTLRVWMIFPIKLPIDRNDNKIFGGGGNFYPSNTLDRTLVIVLYYIDIIVWYTYFALYGSLGNNGM